VAFCVMMCETFAAGWLFRPAAAAAVRLAGCCREENQPQSGTASHQRLLLVLSDLAAAVLLLVLSDLAAAVLLLVLSDLAAALGRSGAPQWMSATSSGTSCHWARGNPPCRKLLRYDSQCDSHNILFSAP
jgi:hypothetical protein